MSREGRSETPFVDFTAGSTILREGDAASALFIIEAGKVAIERADTPGVVLVELGPGEFFGEMSILQEQPHSANAIARTAVRALRIDSAAFHAVLRENVEVAVHLMRRLVTRLKHADQRRLELEAQLARTLAGGRPPASSAGAAVAPAAAPVVASPPAAAPPPPAAAPAPVPPSAQAAPARAPVAAAAPANAQAATAPTPASAPPAAAPAPASAQASTASSPQTRPQPEATRVVPAVADAVAPVPAGAAAARPPAAAASPPAAPPAPAVVSSPAAVPAPAATPMPATPAPAPPPPPAAASVPAASAAPQRYVLSHTAGVVALPEDRVECVVGRPDPATGAIPEINLGPLDLARSLSRRHARLFVAGNAVSLREEPGVANGTWVNGVRLEPGQTITLKPGDKLRFGAIELEFGCA